MKFKFVSQLESNDCGPACLLMVAKYHGINVSLRQIKVLCSVTRMGVSVGDIVNGGKKLGLQSGAFKLLAVELDKAPLPLVLFWKQEHFVVLHDIRVKKGKTYYHIADPAYGNISIDSEVLEKEWLGHNEKGVAMLFQAGENTVTDTYENIPAETSEKLSLPKRIREILVKNKWKYIGALVLLGVGLIANWLIPLLFRRVIDDGIVKGSMSVVVSLLLAQFFFFIGNFVSGFFSDLILTRLNFKLAISFKEGFLSKLLKLPINYFDTRLNTDTLQRLSDLSKIQSFLTWKGISFCLNVLNLIAFSFILLFLNLKVFLIFFVSSVLAIVWIAYFLKKRAVLEYSMFIRQSENSNTIYEFIMNMPEIKINGAQTTLINKIKALQHKLQGLELRSLYLNSYQLSGANFFLRLKDIITIALVALLIIRGELTIGTLLSIYYILGQLNSPALSIINNIRDWQDARISNDRVQEVYQVNDESSDNAEVDFINDDIHLNHVSFKYPGSFNRTILKDINLTIGRNETTAIVGTSGSGKTTLLKLLLQYYVVNDGAIFVGEKSLTDLDPDSWRQRCGVVLQDGHIFSGTIRFNIALLEDKDIDQDKLQESIRIACLEEFVDDLPMGLNTKIGNVGLQISGGQKQRILIARAIYKDPQYLFFDEATSSLDANTEKAILYNLNEFFKNRTVVVIAHRLSTVKNADQIIVLESGKIIENGNHNDLVHSKGQYYSLVKNQLELSN